MEELIDIHFNGQLQAYFFNCIEKKDYSIFYSDIIDDFYWNLAYLKQNHRDLAVVLEEIKKEMKQIKRQPVIYITSQIINNKLEKEITKNKLKLLYTDVWMTIENMKIMKPEKGNLDFSIKKVDKNLQKQFIQAVMNGFSEDNPDDPYGSLSEGYQIALEKTFVKNNSPYHIVNYIGIIHHNAIATATAIYHKNKAILYNVTTQKDHQKQGVCKQMMYYILQDLAKVGIKTTCVQTEQGFYPEQVYQKLGFTEMILGKAYGEE